LRLREAGYELPAQPEGESCAVRWLCFAALLRATPLARAAAGGQHSVFIDGEGRLVVRHGSGGRGGRGEKKDEDEEVEFPGLLGHGEGVLQLKTRRRRRRLK